MESYTEKYKFGTIQNKMQDSNDESVKEEIISDDEDILSSKDSVEISRNRSKRIRKLAFCFNDFCNISENKKESKHLQKIDKYRSKKRQKKIEKIAKKLQSIKDNEKHQEESSYVIKKIDTLKLSDVKGKRKVFRKKKSDREPSSSIFLLLKSMGMESHYYLMDKKAKKRKARPTEEPKTVEDYLNFYKLVLQNRKSRKKK